MHKYPAEHVDASDPARGPGRPGSSVPARILITVALFGAVVLLVSSVQGLPGSAHAYLSALPLALAGFAYALLQIVVRPPRGTLLKRLLLAATFIGWAVAQLLPAGPAANFIGDSVIAAYVLDLYWIVQEQIGRDNAQR